MKMLFLNLVTTLTLITLTTQAQQRAISPVEILNLQGGGNIAIYYSPKPTLEIRSDKNVIKVVESLLIGTPFLKQLNLSGGGEVEVRNGFGLLDSLICTIRGGGNVNVLTRVNFLSASVSGGGHVSASDIKYLEGSIHCGGNIFYNGTAVVKRRNIAEGGKLTKF